MEGFVDYDVFESDPTTLTEMLQEISGDLVTDGPAAARFNLSDTLEEMRVAENLAVELAYFAEDTGNNAQFEIASTTVDFIQKAIADLDIDTFEHSASVDVTASLSAAQEEITSASVFAVEFDSWFMSLDYDMWDIMRDQPVLEPDGKLKAVVNAIEATVGWAQVTAGATLLVFGRKTEMFSGLVHGESPGFGEANPNPLYQGDNTWSADAFDAPSDDPGNGSKEPDDVSSTVVDYWFNLSFDQYGETGEDIPKDLAKDYVEFVDAVLLAQSDEIVFNETEDAQAA